MKDCQPSGVGCLLGHADEACETIERAGLRSLPGLYLNAVERDGTLMPAVGPETRLQSGDRLGFVGILDSVIVLRKIKGLVAATDQVSKVGGSRHDRTLIEAVVSHASPLVGRSIRASQFRTVYNAAVLSVHRGDQAIAAKIGDIVIMHLTTISIHILAE